MSQQKSLNTLNETPRASTKKTVSALKYLIVGVCLLGLLLIGFLLLNQKSTVSIKSVNNLGSSAFLAEARIAETKSEQQKGLGGKDKLSDDEAMLFVFTENSSHSIWMKDMKFSIDIVWIDETKKIVNIASNISPETYPESFSSPRPSKYVLELSAGTSARKNLSVGAQLEFNL